MPTPSTDIANLYNILGAGELSRLDAHPIELLVTLRTISEALPPAPRRIADVGGGPGKYAFALADEGYLVDLVDLSPGLIQLAQVEQDKQESERVEAVANAARLAAPNGLLFVAFVSVAAHLRDIAMREPERLVAEKEFYAKYLQDGRYEKLKPGVGNVHSFHTQVGDVKSFFADNFAGTLELVELRSQEGILGGNLDAALSKSQPQVLQAWADLMYEKYSTGEEHLGCADHLIAVLKKRSL
ncbi:S-adenosyl-L-methionine-dependent methyltransferase [Trichoderma sp. TUCIM 5745]